VLQQQSAIDSSVHPLSLHDGFITGYSEPSGFSNVDQISNRPGSHVFNTFPGLGQSGMEQTSVWGQTEYLNSPGHAGANDANFNMNEPIIGFHGLRPVNHVIDTSTPIFNGVYENGFTADTNYLDQRPDFFISYTQHAASDTLGWPMVGELTTAATALATPPILPEGRPMNRMQFMQPNPRASISQTGRMPLRPASAGVSKKRKGGFPCPEGCGTNLGRPHDIGRHVAQKHGGATLPCPVDGCDKVFSRPDKRSDHLKKGHKLGPKVIEMLLGAKLGEEKM
jgi:hypothetical protein